MRNRIMTKWGGGVLVILLALSMAFVFASCEDPEDTEEATCENCKELEADCVCTTVWVGTVTKEVFEAASKYYAPSEGGYTSSEEDADFSTAKRNELVKNLTEKKMMDGQIKAYIKDTLKFPDSQTEKYPLGQATTLAKWLVESPKCEYLVADNKGTLDIIVK